MTNVHWKYDGKTRSFIMQEWKDKDTDDYLLMEILTKKEGDKIYFTMEEMYFVLEVKKVEYSVG